MEKNYYEVEAYLKTLSGVQIYNLKHAWRLNGVIDVWKNIKTIFIKTENIYLNFDNWTEMEECILDAIKKNPNPVIPIKKLKTGRMSYQEFRNNMFQKNNNTI